MNNRVVNFLAFQLGWFGCVICAANALPLAGLAIAAGVVGWHLWQSPRPGAESALVAAAVLCGLLFDSLLVGSGWLRYPSGVWLPGAAPYWILAMWAMFATTLNVSMRWMRGRLSLAALLGGVFGPLSYQAGARLGGLEFLDEGRAMVALAAVWAIAMPVLVILARRFDGIGAEGEGRGFKPVAQGEGS